MDPYLAKLIGRTTAVPATDVPVTKAQNDNVLLWNTAAKHVEREGREAFDPSRSTLRKVMGLTPGTTKYTSRGRTFILVTGPRSEQQHWLLMDELLLVEHERRQQQRQRCMAQGDAR
jgi:hypothetical protein